jgi:hypothetical protein
MKELKKSRELDVHAMCSKIMNEEKVVDVPVTGSGSVQCTAALSLPTTLLD